jgi:EmrB/QacA subfamily drug resistance transporter
MPSSSPSNHESSGTGTTAHPTATIFTSILGSSLAFIDGSVVNVALPTIARDLHAGPAALAWTVNAYLLPLGALILFGGAAGDHYGRRRLFMLGVTIFLAASALCSFAPSIEVLLIARCLQGIGAALLMPNSLAMLGAGFSGEARGRAIGTWAAVGAIAGAIGPVIGGWIVDVQGWRPIFLLNLPIGGGALWLAWRYASESHDKRPGAKLDWAGGAIATCALGALVWALTGAAEQGTSRAALIASAVVGLVLFAVFLKLEAARGADALMPFGLFGTSTFVGLSVLTFLLYAALGGLIVLLPFTLIRVGHYSAAEAGAAMLPIPALIGGASRMMGRVAEKFGGRRLLTTGSAIVAVGLALYARLGSDAMNYWRDVLPPTLIIAIGMAICVAPLTTSVMASVDANHVGAASGFNSALARIGGLIATALLGFVFAVANDAAALVAHIHIAAWVGAVSAASSSLAALLLMKKQTKQ